MRREEEARQRQLKEESEPVALFSGDGPEREFERRVRLIDDYGRREFRQDAPEARAIALEKLVQRYTIAVPVLDLSKASARIASWSSTGAEHSISIAWIVPYAGDRVVFTFKTPDTAETIRAGLSNKRLGLTWDGRVDSIDDANKELQRTLDQIEESLESLRQTVAPINERIAEAARERVLEATKTSAMLTRAFAEMPFPRTNRDEPDPSIESARRKADAEKKRAAAARRRQRRRTWFARHRMWWIPGCAAAAVLALVIVVTGFRFPGISTGQVWGAELGSAIVSGLVAAGVALLVVDQSDRRERRRDAQRVAEDRLLALVDAVTADADWNRTFHDVRPVLASRATTAPPSASEFRSVAKEHLGRIRHLRPGTETAVRRVDPGRLSDLTSGLNLYHQAVSMYLGHVEGRRVPRTEQELASEIHVRAEGIVKFVEEWNEAHPPR